MLDAGLVVFRGDSHEVLHDDRGRYLSHENLDGCVGEFHKVLSICNIRFYFGSNSLLTDLITIPCHQFKIFTTSRRHLLKSERKVSRTATYSKRTPSSEIEQHLVLWFIPIQNYAVRGYIPTFHDYFIFRSYFLVRQSLL